MSQPVSDVTRLLFDGIRLVLQVLVDQKNASFPHELNREIQQWFDDCYRLLEGKDPL